jgi:hypothetical protein
MPDEILEGDWDDLVRRADLHGRKVRVIVLEQANSDASSNKAWIERLLSWADNHKSVGYQIDDSRESIYSGTLDDPR